MIPKRGGDMIFDDPWIVQKIATKKVKESRKMLVWVNEDLFF